MKRKNNYLKEVSVFSIVVLLMATCVVVQADTLSVEPVEMFKQEPEIPENEPQFAASDIDEPWRAYEDFWDLPYPIFEIHWWNVAGKFVGNNIYPSDPEGAVFTITLYEDDGTGKPGNIVCTYENVMPSITGTGIMYEQPSDPLVHGSYELYYYEAVLSSSCELSDGWVSIVKTDSIHDLIGGIIISKDGNENMCFYNTDQQAWSFYELDLSFALYAYIPDNQPPEKPDSPRGEINCKLGEEYVYYASTTDPEGDDVFYLFDWGNGMTSFIMGPYESGAECNASNIWFEKGDYEVKVQAIDEFDAESEWSDPLLVSMPKTKATETNNEIDSMMFCDVLIKGTATEQVIRGSFFLGFGKCLYMKIDLEDDGSIEIKSRTNPSNSVELTGGHQIHLIGFNGYYGHLLKTRIDGKALFVIWG